MSFIIGQPSGGGGGGSDAWSVQNTITDFADVIGSPSAGTGNTANRAYYIVLQIDSNCVIKNMGFKINSLSTNVGAKMYGALYKYDISTDSINLIDAMPTEIIADNVSGVVGFNYVNFTSNLNIEPGVYFTRVITNLTSITIGYVNSWNRAMGIVGTGTSSSYYYGFYQNISYDFGSTPSNINVSSLVKATNSSQAAFGKAFFTLV